jgi:hypothetical protein
MAVALSSSAPNSKVALTAPREDSGIGKGTSFLIPLSSRGAMRATLKRGAKATVGQLFLE